MSPAAVAARKPAVFLALFFSALAIFPQRVVSLAPGLTEIVFAIGCGDTLVGVTKFCDHPQAAKRIEKVGGFLDVSMEALVALEPDIVIAYPEHAARMKLLPSRVRMLTARHDRLSDLLGSMLEIGRVLGGEKAAERLVASIRQRLRLVKLRVRGERKPRVLFIAGRNTQELKNMFIIGNNDFLNDLLQVAGGVNAYRGNIDYPSISLETVIALDPEFIFEISSHYEGITDERIFALWRPLSMVSAVSGGRVRVVRDPAWLRPGPRVAGVAEELSRTLHPQRSSPAPRETGKND